MNIFGHVLLSAHVHISIQYLPNNEICMSLSRHIFSVDTIKQFFKVAIITHLPSSSVFKFFFLHPSQHLLLVFLLLVTLMDIEWFQIFLVIKELKSSFLCLLSFGYPLLWSASLCLLSIKKRCWCFPYCF